MHLHAYLTKVTGSQRYLNHPLMIGLLGGLTVLASSPLNAEPTQDTIALKEVVVTAQKREETLQQVPISISVVQTKDMNNTHARTLADMQQLIPNASIAGPAGDPTITIRGVGGGGRNIGFDTRVGVYLDGVYIGQSQALNIPLLDIERVEVLRGPQGYLFGRNTDAGAVNITTKPPSDKFEAYYKTGFGRYQSFENYAGISGPVSDSAQAKVALGYESRDGFGTNDYNHERIDGIDRFSTRAQFSMQPTDRFSIDVSADDADIKQNNIYGETTTSYFGAPLSKGAPAPYTVNLDTPPYVRNRINGANFTTNYELSNGSTLTTISGYRHTFQERVIDDDFSPANLLDVNFKDTFNQLSQELRIASATNQSVRYVGGIYLMHESADSYRTATIGRDTNTLIQFPFLPNPAPFGAVLGVSAGSVIPVAASIDTVSYALFGSVDYDIGQSTTLNLGARYSYERKNLDYSLDGSKSGGLGIGTLLNHEDGFSDGNFSPTLGISYKLNADNNLYAKYASGFKSGGWNVDFLTPTQLSSGIKFNKETVDSYELGLKGTTTNHRMQYALALFLSQYQDYQVSQLVNLAPGIYELQLRNAASVESKGLEASMTTLLSDTLKCSANIGLLNARFMSFPNGLDGGLDAAGKHLPEAPEVSAVLSVNYSIPAPAFNGRLELYAEDSYRSKSSSGVSNNASVFSVDSRNLVNARLSYINQLQHLDVSLYATNLFNEQYITARGRDFLGSGLIKRGDPQMIGMQARYDF